MKIGIKIENGSLEFSSDPIGQLTNSTYTDFYVYEWFIKETGEIFYVGKGRKNRYKEYHARADKAEKIKNVYETDIKFIARNLTEKQAIELETYEMTRILNETTDRLTNRFIPYFAERDNGYGRSFNTPKIEYEKAPCLYACEIDNHYFNTSYRPFDQVQLKDLKAVYFIKKSISSDVINVVYGNNYEKYYNETIKLLELDKNKVIKTKYAKSVTAWIYSDAEDIAFYDFAQQQANEKLGKHIPAYHLIDVWKLLISIYGTSHANEVIVKITKPNNYRVPLNEIKNIKNWDKGFDEGFRYWEYGELKRKSDEFEEAISLFDKARFYGYLAPALYNSYAMAYRKLKDHENEIEILDEGIIRFQSASINVNPTVINKWKQQKEKAVQELQKRRKTIVYD